MNRKRKIAWTLILVCVVMLLAAVFPHHHHHDMTLCMHEDVHTCNNNCPETDHHHLPFQECEDGCVAFFQSSLPQSVYHIHPDYCFFVYLDFLKDSLKLVLFENHIVEYPEDRPERLSTSEYYSTGGLRAPPQA